ncbi:hypothetical protein [Fulvimarina manganoxydans]|uniref:hypothetical protein n=1 Tax=Fulvimarina manganoxydans TaxID=937218 RepID=UPI000A047355|nr:hypothetical protein [Fulvimarina manganoxydans]
MAGAKAKAFIHPASAIFCREIGRETLQAKRVGTLKASPRSTGSAAAQPNRPTDTFKTLISNVFL